MDAAAKAWNVLASKDILNNNLAVQWNFSKAEIRSSEQMFENAVKVARTPGKDAVAKGNLDGAFSPANKTIEAEYLFPFLAHVPMEPLDAVIEVRDGSAECWMGS